MGQVSLILVDGLNQTDLRCFASQSYGKLRAEWHEKCVVGLSERDVRKHFVDRGLKHFQF